MHTVVLLTSRQSECEVTRSSRRPALRAPLHARPPRLTRSETLAVLVDCAQRPLDRRDTPAHARDRFSTLCASSPSRNLLIWRLAQRGRSRARDWRKIRGSGHEKTDDLLSPSRSRLSPYSAPSPRLQLFPASSLAPTAAMATIYRATYSGVPVYEVRTIAELAAGIRSPLYIPVTSTPDFATSNRRPMMLAASPTDALSRRRRHAPQVRCLAECDPNPQSGRLRQASAHACTRARGAEGDA